MRSTSAENSNGIRGKKDSHRCQNAKLAHGFGGYGGDGNVLKTSGPLPRAVSIVDLLDPL